MERIVYLNEHSFWLEYDWTGKLPVIEHIECLSDEVMLYRNGWLSAVKQGQKLTARDVDLYTMDRAQRTTLKDALIQELMLEPAYA